MDWPKVRQDAAQEISELEARLARLRELARMIDLLAPSGPGELSVTSATNSRELPPSPVEPEISVAAPHSHYRIPHHGGETRYDRIVRAMRGQGGRPMAIAEIRDLLRKMGDGEGKADPTFYNIIDSALRSGAKRGLFYRTESGFWGLGRGILPTPDVEQDTIDHSQGQLKSELFR